MKQPRFKIYGLIDLVTGELVAYSPSLAAEVEELQPLLTATATAQAHRDLLRVQIQRPPRQLKPAPAGDGVELARELFADLFSR